MTVTINGTTGIDKVQDGSIQAADLASGVPSRSQLPAGTVLQVVQSATTLTTSTSSSAWQETTLYATITPTNTTSKILIIVAGGGLDSKFAGRQAWLGIGRGGTIFTSTTDLYTDTTRVIAPVALSYLDSPASTSALTYRLYVRSSTSNDIGFNTQAEAANITLMEIAA